MTLFDPMFGSEVVDRIFSDSTRLQRMLDFEAALARAEAKVGVIPAAAATAIARKCDSALFDLGSLATAAIDAGNLAIPMVKQLTDLLYREDQEAARYVHWGATSQDAIDTGLVLQLRDAIEAISVNLTQLCALLEKLAADHRATPVAARTWLQQAVPTVFGLKVAGWLDAMTRHCSRLQELRARVFVLQFGGAAGTLASLREKGLDVAAALAKDLALNLPAMPWHAHRDRIAEVATTLALLTGTLGKVARDLSLEMQTEVAEVFEPAGKNRGGSSTMPQKRNPVASAVILAAATRVPSLASTMLAAMSQEHERGLGGWQAEWETLPELVRLTAGALHRLVETIAGLEVDTDRMQRNLEVTHGLIFAEAVAMTLAKHVGKRAAHQIVEAAVRQAFGEKKHLREVLAANPEASRHLSSSDLKSLFEPANYAGMADQFINRAIAGSQTPTTENR
jgi:3-carboxy-cis,cis-muconate cycloisomerase